MRTKNLNLKKKLAFIASVAMIASTAAYLPADFAKDIGISTGIVAEAVDDTAATYADITKDNYKYTQVGAIAQDTFTAYVKVNNKYLAKKGSEYVTYRSIAEMEADTTAVAVQVSKTGGELGNYLTVAPATDATAASGSTPATPATPATAEKYNKFKTSDNLFTVRTDENGPVAKVTLPVEIATPGSAIAVEVVADGDAAVKSTNNTVEVTLDDHGMAVVPKQSSLIEVQGDTYKAQVGTSGQAGYSAPEGDREFIDLTGLKFEVSTAPGTYTGFAVTKIDDGESTPTVIKNNAFTASTGSADTAAKIYPYAATQTPAQPESVDAITAGPLGGFNEVVTNAAKDDTNAKSYEYAWTKSGNEYVRNFVGTLNKEAAPGTTVTVDLGYKNNWNVTGTNVRTENDKKVLKLTLGSDGTATSGVITFTKNDVTEKVIITVLNHDSNIDNQNLKVNVGTFGVETSAKAFGKEAKSVDNTGVDDAYKITSKKEVQSVSSNNKFVTVYTIANNSTDTTSTPLEFVAAGGVEFATNVSAKIEWVSATQAKGVKISGNTKIETAAFDYTNEGLKEEGDMIDAPANSLDGKQFVNIIVTPETGKGANAKTPVLAYGTKEGSCFQFDITTSYEIPVDNKNTKDENATLGKTTVSGQTVTKPSNPTKAGYTFNGYFTDETGGTKIFDKSVAQQQNYDEVNPNITLYAQYTENQYNITLNANNGYFVNSKISGYTKTTFATFDDVSQATVITKTITSGDENDDVLSLEAASAVVRDGYTFKGFATSATATEDDVLKFEDFDTVRPAAANGSLTLYAVWKAEDYTATFLTLDLKDDGSNADETVEATYTSKGASFATGTNSTVSVKMGEAFGELPTPVKNGYEFVGWYLKKDTTPNASGTHKFAAVAVSSTKKLAYEDLDTDELKLYAKFRQAKYNVTFDLDGGVFEGADKTNFKEISYYKVNGKTNTVEFYDKNNKELVFTGLNANADYSDYDAKKGSGAYFEFKGWNIGTNTDKVETANLAEKLAELPKAEDVTIKAVFERNTTVSGKGYYALELNKGGWYDYNATSKKYFEYKTGETGEDQGVKIVGTKGADVEEEFDKNIVTETSNKKYALMRPGYTFTGWYTDEACTQLFDFSTAKYPDETEVTLYAGWKPVTTTSYTLKCLLVDGDGSIVTSADGKSFPQDDIEENGKVYVGATGSTADASKMSLTYNGKKYVFDAERSAEYETSAEIEAEWKEYLKYADDFESAENEAAAKAIEKPWVVGSTLTSKGVTTIYGVFAEEGTVEKTLGTATNVQAKDGTVTFTAAANADHYKVQKTWTVNGVEKTATGAAFTGTTGTYNVPTGDYKIAIVAYNADGSKSTVSAAVEVKGAAVTLGKATNLNVKDGTVTFTAAAGADHYRVQKTYTVNGTTKTAKGSKFTTTTGTFGVPEGDYKIAIIAYADAAETQFTVSDAKEVKAATIDLEAVDTASITVNRGTGEVSWTASKGAKEYVVFKIVKENGKSKIYGGRRTSETTYKFANFPTDDFKVYIASIDANENKVYSATKKISTLPSATNVKVSDDYKTVSWTKATGDKADKIVKYQVAKFDSTTNKYSYGTKVDASQSSFTLGVKAKAGQQIFVIAFDADGNSSYSDAITVK